MVDSLSASNFLSTLLAVKWVSDMSKATDDDVAEVQLKGRPLGLGLGATVPRQQNVGPVTDPVERKLRANLAMAKRKADENIETVNDGNGVESSDEDDDDLDSRSSVFTKKKMVTFDPSSQAKKKKKR